MSIEPLAAGDLPGVFDLYRRTVSFPPANRVEEYWRWKFCSNPCGGEAPRAWVARNDGRVVGMMAQIPVVLDLGAASLPAAWAVDFMVDPDARGQGIGRRIFDHYRQSNDVAVSMGYAPESATSRVARAVGFQGLPPVPYLFKLLTIKPLTLGSPLNGLLGPTVNRLSGLALRRFGRLRPSSAAHIEETPRFTASFDALWSRVAADAGVSVRRTHRTMNWRYLDNPFHRYRVFAALDRSDLAGCLVLKVVRHDGFSYGTIAELVAPAAALDVQESLLAAALKVFEDAGVDVVKALATPPSLARLLRRAGFRSLGQRSDFVIAVAPGVEPAHSDLVRDPRAWYLTKGDCDLDMVPDFMSKVSPLAS